MALLSAALVGGLLSAARAEVVEPPAPLEHSVSQTQTGATARSGVTKHQVARVERSARRAAIRTAVVAEANFVMVSGIGF
jgi:hypothetical protein